MNLIHNGVKHSTTSDRFGNAMFDLNISNGTVQILVNDSKFHLFNNNITIFNRSGFIMLEPYLAILLDFQTKEQVNVQLIKNRIIIAQG